MSEIPQIGRNPVYIGTLIAFVVLQLPVIYARNFAMLLAFRFLTGKRPQTTAMINPRIGQ